MICSRYDKNVQSLCSGLLKNEKVIILPTDTVYGFSGIIEKTDSEIRKIKGRAETKPFIVLIAFPGDINEITDDEIPENLLNLWPGPLTIIVSDKKKPENTVAVRCPGDEWLRKIIEECGSPIYSTSVNRSGSPVLSKVKDIVEEFETDVSLIVDGGDSMSSVPSTIVKLTDDGYEVVRDGVIKL